MLAHELIKKDIEIVDLLTQSRYSSEEIFNYTQYLKNSIFQGLGGKTVNKIVYVDTNNFFIVVCSMIATWELGAGLFLNDVDPKVKDLPYFKKFYSVVDVVIGPQHGSKWVPDSSLHIITDSYNFDKIKKFDKFNELLDQPITQDTVCYYTTSSGTTGDPKLLPFTHYQTVTISNEIKQYLTLDETCRPYHFKTLHHSSLFNSFALPLLNSCKTHYCGLFQGRAEEFLTRVSDAVQQHSLTHFLVPYNWISNFSNVSSNDFKKNLTLITIQGNTDQKMKDLFARFNPKQVINYFGTSEVGTMFISRTTQDTLHEYNPNRFVDVTSFIDYQLLENQVNVKWKHVDEWYVISDKIVHDNGAIWLYGRDLYFVSDNTKLELAQIQHFLKEQLGTDNFILVPDYKLEKLYLNLYNISFTDQQLQDLNLKIVDTFGRMFSIADVFNFTREELEYGMKINGSLLLYLFRERNK
jgi:acyl-CoA synthetase (AMP-forming)/AMP-acid ligase II